MLISQVLFTTSLFFSAFACAMFLPTKDRSSRPTDISPGKIHEEIERFPSSETVFEIAKGLGKVQKRKSSLHRLSQKTVGQIVNQDIVSTQFHFFNTTFNLSINGGIWGYNQKPGYYRFANGTVSTDSSTVDIGNDIALLGPRQLTVHVLQSVEELNNVAYLFLGVKVCGGDRNLHQVLNPLPSDKVMTAMVSKAPTGVSIGLKTGAQIVPPASLDSAAALAVAFVTIMNDGILQRIHELGWVDLVDALVVEVYLALGHRVAEQAQALTHGDCVPPRHVVAGMDAVSVTLESLTSQKMHDEEVQEL